MSVRNTVRALPALARVGFAEAVAYRAEMLIWVLSTTMPLVMMALWTAVASEAPVGRFGEQDFVAYFLSVFIVRQLTGAWAAWQINYEVRNGALSQRLLRPVSPIAHYAVENLAAVPLRLVVALPVAAILLWTVGARYVSHDPVAWALWPAALLGSWLITFLLNVIAGTLSLFMESSLKVMEVYFTLFAVLSGYLVPVDLIPGALGGLVRKLPFRFQIDFPVKLMTKKLDQAELLQLLAGQWGYVVLLGGLAFWLWRRGLRRYAAFGG